MHLPPFLFAVGTQQEASSLRMRTPDESCSPTSVCEATVRYDEWFAIFRVMPFRHEGTAGLGMTSAQHVTED